MFIIFLDTKTKLISYPHGDSSILHGQWNVTYYQNINLKVV